MLYDINILNTKPPIFLNYKTTHYQVPGVMKSQLKKDYHSYQEMPKDRTVSGNPASLLVSTAANSLGRIGARLPSSSCNSRYRAAPSVGTPAWPASPATKVTRPSVRQNGAKTGFDAPDAGEPPPGMPGCRGTLEHDRWLAATVALAVGHRQNTAATAHLPQLVQS